MKKRKLTPKEKKFRNEFIKKPVGATAAIKAGYSKRSARQIAHRLMTKDYIKESINEGIEKAADTAIVDAAFVLEGLKDVALRCRQARPVMDFDKEERQMIHVTATNADGEEVGLWEFDSTGANKSLELLGKHLGIFVEQSNTRHHHTGSVNATVKLTPSVQKIIDAMPIELVIKMAEKL